MIAVLGQSCALAAALSFTGSSPSYAPAGEPARAQSSSWREESWRDDPIWHDGLAEKCVYQAERTIYERPRSYLAVVYTDKELYDPKTTCKSETDEGIEVFKHHWSEQIPTENYDYRFSTMSYTRASGTQLLKLSVSTQEDCGASFKETWLDGDTWPWIESVYFPGGGRREGRLNGHGTYSFFDALTVTLRSFDFESGHDLVLSLVPSQKDTHRVAFEVARRIVHPVGRKLLELPIGDVEGYGLELKTPEGAVEASFWFAVDPKPPRLRVLLDYQGPNGVRFRLQSQERLAYWKH